MSFNIEFNARARLARLMVQDDNHLPVSVRAFLTVALSGFQDEQLMHVKAVGHISDNGYRSSGDFIVEQILVRG